MPESGSADVRFWEQVWARLSGDTAVTLGFSTSRFSVAGAGQAIIGVVRLRGDGKKRPIRGRRLGWRRKAMEEMRANGAGLAGLD
jgi:hypothetical protein